MEGESQYNIATLVAALQSVMKIRNVVEGSRTTVIGILDCLLNENLIQETIDVLPNDIFVMLLGDKSKEIVARTAKAIADIAKTEKGREKCTNLDIVKALTELLEEENINILTQASRALGNICYENKNGKIMVKERDGLKRILLMLKKYTMKSEEKNSDIVRRAASGLLLNFLVDQESLQQEVLEEKENIIPILRHILEIDKYSEGPTVTYILLTLGVLNDSNVIFLDEKLIKLMTIAMCKSRSREINEVCLGLFYDQAEDDKVKFLLTQARTPEFLIKLIECLGPKSTDEETRSLLKVAYNLMVLILTEDNSMNWLYEDGYVYDYLVECLDSTDEDLQVTAVLAMGNFARKDTNCRLMVEKGIHKKLLTLLQKNDSKNSKLARLQHALLSALHNLVIPAINKPIILKDGLIDTLYPMLDIPTFPIVFKLLGTLRIVIDGQKEAAISLGKREDLVKRTVEWCSTDHPGVRGEANRLLAWLINNSKDICVAQVIIKLGGAEYLIKMILAEHALMQNEAILSLTSLATICLSDLENVLIKNNIDHTIHKFFEECVPNLELPIIYNMLSFIDSIIKSGTLKRHIKNNAGLTTALKNILDDSTNFDSNLKLETQTIYNHINSFSD